MENNNTKLITRKSNKIVQHCATKFTYHQNQLMCLLLGKYVNLTSDECINTTIPVDELRKALNLNDCADNYIAIRKAIKNFGANGSVGFLEKDYKGDYSYTWMPFFSKIKVDKNICEFVWNEEMKPFLVHQQNNFTQYLASDYLKLSSVYSQNLYEQMKSLENYRYNYNHTLPRIEVSELRQIMQVGKKYKDFNNFKTICLQRAVDDINKKTDLFVRMNNVKKGRSVVAIEFDILRKDQKFNYEGCWMNYTEVDDIVKKRGKCKIYELAKIKKDNQKYYQMLRQGNKTDYEIVLNFIKQDIKADQFIDECTDESLPSWYDQVDETPASKESLIKALEMKEQFLQEPSEADEPVIIKEGELPF